MSTLNKINLHGEEYDLVPAPILLENGTNFDDVREPNNYALNNASTAGYINCPFASSTGSLTVEKCGESAQLHQIAKVCSKTNQQTYERFYYGSAWGEWVNTSNWEGKLLWSGHHLMVEGQTITLAEKISQQSHGIVLIFSAYLNGEAQNYDIQQLFVHKQSVEMYAGCGNTFILSAANFTNVCTKYMYIHDTHLVGNARNDDVGTSNGISYNSAAFVLRHVIGI